MRSRCYKSLSPDICISDKTSVVDGVGNQGLNVSFLSWSISSSSGEDPHRMDCASGMSEDKRLRGLNTVGTATKDIAGALKSHFFLVHSAVVTLFGTRSFPPN